MLDAASGDDAIDEEEVVAVLVAVEEKESGE